MALSLEKAGKIPASEEYYDLGPHSWKISTQVHDAQVWFNRGLIWAYCFNHRESAACFEQVVKHDPECAIGYWGVAFSSGPNYNKVWMAFDKNDLKASLVKCYDYSRKAKEFSATASPVEQALIDALQYRFPSKEVPKDFSPWVMAYADAMGQVHREFGSDLDIATLCADALMNTAPWNLYRAQTGEPNLRSPVLEVHGILDPALEHPNAKHHPGVLHMYIHLVEMSSTPERAVKPADYLRNLVPDGGHMHHMPSHIDVLVGDFRRSLHTNLRATIADEKYYAKEGGKNFYSFYRMHNYHSLIYAAMMCGHSGMALDGCTRMEATITKDMLLIDSPPMADWLEFFLSVRVHVLIRFGMWEELKKLHIPDNKELYCVTVAMTHYGRGIAWAATSNIEKADKERELFREAALRVPPTRLIFPNKVTNVLKVTTAMLDGEIEYRRGNYKDAFVSLRLAIKYDDSLIYAEPWAWMLPTRHPYAALSLEQGNVEEAARVYAEDLGLDDKLPRAHQHHNNVWSLHGYYECLARLGCTAEAAMVKKQLTIAAAGADIDVESSCFCRLETAPKKACCKI
ncbi:tpr domain [Fusarium albosuccineum]|uniref:Tpr domain n=1 Tax=Fusarium albosuccineum TaxID=1237068 RepID=A0A8H4L4Y5_9HYPO|nr:tpr domain [Fusarium albosuccineum]